MFALDFLDVLVGSVLLLSLALANAPNREGVVLTNAIRRFVTAY